MEYPPPKYDPLKSEEARTQTLHDRDDSKGHNTDHALRCFTGEPDVSSDSEFEGNGFDETDDRSPSSSCLESPHVESIFIFQKTLAHLPSSPCNSILRMTGSIVKTRHVHHVATRFVHPIPSLASYNREYLQTRTEMCLLTALNKQNTKVILASDGIHKLSHTRWRTL